MRKRYKHNLSHYRMHTCDMGNLIPISCVPVLPGDTIQQSTSVLVRVSPLNTPVMHPVQVRLHHFFVPNRIIWDGWEDFITGGSDGNDNSQPPVTNVGVAKNGVMNYLGCSPVESGSYEANALPLRAYNKIFNEYYRDQDLISEVAEQNLQIQNCAWEKDYLTTARPFTQKGDDVTLPIGTRAPVTIDTGEGSNVAVYSNFETELRNLTESGGNVKVGDALGALDELSLKADLSQAEQISINAFRTGFALQRYKEARARYGSRFVEYLRYLGIRPSDARLQRPEFLAGGVTRLNFSEVLQTTPDSPGIGVGDLYGHGIAGVRTPAYRKFFEEHGYVITMFSARPKSLYVNATPREFFKKTKEDYFQRELANLGQQEVFNGEVYNDDHKSTFGFQDRYHEYRSQPSQVGQDFRDLLNAWHLGRDLNNTTDLNGLFVTCTPSKRIHQVESNDVLWIMANHRIVARRMVPKTANPRIL